MKSQDQKPLVSVIVPAHNAETTLTETLASVAAQRYRNLEIVIVDDGSTDRTPQIAATFAEADGRARVMSINNGGVAVARNTGIAASTGTFVAPIDADDLWHPDYIAKAMHRILAAPAPVAFAYAACLLIDEDSNVIGAGLNARAEGTVVYRMLYCNLVGNGSGMVIPRAAIEAAGGYDLRLHAAGCQGCEDYLLQLTLAALGPACAIGEYLVGYRQRASAMSRDISSMAASARLARKLNRAASAIDQPRWLRRWIKARGLLRAASAAKSGGRAIWLVAQAALIDPVATGAAIAARIGLLARFWGRGPRSRIHFLDVDPARPDGGKEIGRAWSPSLFGSIQINRLKRIAALDGALSDGVDAPVGIDVPR